MWSPILELGPYHFSGTKKFGVEPRFLENLYTHHHHHRRRRRRRRRHVCKDVNIFRKPITHLQEILL